MDVMNSHLYFQTRRSYPIYAWIGAEHNRFYHVDLPNEQTRYHQRILEIHLRPEEMVACAYCDVSASAWRRACVR
jgi:hypothetical protein